MYMWNTCRMALLYHNYMYQQIYPLMQWNSFQLDTLADSNPLGIPKSWTMSAVGNSGFPQGLAAPLTSTTTPGSPAKPGFQPISQPSSVGGLQGISSQLQSKGTQFSLQDTCIIYIMKNIESALHIYLFSICY